MIQLASSNDEAVVELLRRHPRVQLVQLGEAPGLSFEVDGWHRQVLQGPPCEGLRGLAELIDNNPLVCADTVRLPSAGTTLGMIALGPLAAAGMIAGSPTMVVNVPTDEAELDDLLSLEGWPEGVIVHHEPLDFGGVVAATLMVEVPTMEDPLDIDEQFEERFGRSFFIRRDEDSVWDAPLVAGTPFAFYRMTIAIDSPNSLLTIRVMADQNGKAGAAQMVHAMNVMCGYEESLGIA